MAAIMFEAPDAGASHTFERVVEHTARQLLAGGPVPRISIRSREPKAPSELGTLTAVEDGYLVIDGVRYRIADNLSAFYANTRE